MAGSSRIPGSGQPGVGAPQTALPRTQTQQTQQTQTEQSLLDAARQRPQGPQYFGYHTDASIMARMAQQGIAPTAVNLRIAQQMLRYGLPLSASTLSHIRQLWQGLGAMSLVDLEALIALFSMGAPIDGPNLKAMLQLLGGGPMSHLFARLTLALKQAQPGAPGQREVDQLRSLLGSYWKLGNGPASLPQELGQFHQLTGRIRQLVDAQMANASRLPGNLATELAAVHQLFQAQQMLQAQRLSTSSVYIPFFQWREQQPMPGELLLQADRETAAQAAANYAQVTVAVDTRNLGRLTIDFTSCRGHLGVQFEVQDQAVRQHVDSGLPSLRRRLGPSTGYTIAGLSVVEVGQGRSISVLLPKRRDLRKLGRAVGVL